MRRSLTSIAWLIVIAGSATAQPKVEAIDKVMLRYATIDEFNGVILVAEKGGILYQNAFGYADFDWRIPNTLDTKFEIASITKTFTALMIMRLVESGRIDLQRTIGDYLPDYRGEGAHTITIDELLVHSSGIERDISDFPVSGNKFPDIVAKINEEFFSLKERVDIIAGRPLLFKPGTDFSYSSDGYDILGRILEIVCGNSYENVLDSLLLRPLAMSESGYKDHYAIIRKRATGYAETYSGVQRARQIGIAPSGGIYSTAGDLLKWEQSLYTNRVITQKSKDLIFRRGPYSPEYGWKVDDNYFGTDTEDSSKVVKCTGALPGFNSLVVRFLRDQRTIIVLENIRRVSYKQDDIVRTIADILYDRPYELPRQSLAKELLMMIQTSGIQSADSLMASFKNGTSEYSLNEQELNSAGYYLMYDLHKVDEAIALFTINTAQFPGSWNAFDSLGEGYTIRGNTEEAIKSYRKSLALNPGNANAQRMIDRLSNK